MLNTTVCDSCTQARGDVVRHAEPCDESVYEVRLNRVQAGFANLQEDLRACITEARATHRVTECQVLEEVLANVELEAMAASQTGMVSPVATRGGAEENAVPSHFSAVDDAICGFDDDDEDDPSETSAEHLCVECGREAIINRLCAMCSELHPELM
jgi:hypothetical protein